MGKKRDYNRKEKRKAKRNNHQENQQNVISDYIPRRNSRPLEALNEAQGMYISAILNSDLTFSFGPAGTGKTYLAGALAAEQIENRTIDRIIITRPAVEAGEEMGFLPGDIEEKFDPYLQPFRDVLNERLGKGHVEALIKGGRIVAQPLAYMRGLSFKDAWIILDEAQNTTPAQMKLFLTRIGKNCKVIVNGDANQKDIRGESGLEDAARRLKGLRSVYIHEFAKADIVRSGLVQDIYERYEN